MPKEKKPNRTNIRTWAKIRLWAGYLYVLAAIILAKPNPPFIIAGLFLILLGIMLRLLSAATLTKDTELVTWGIYSATRNPLYFGSSLIGLGFAFLASRWEFFAALFLILVPLYVRMILLEEKFLSELYPESTSAYFKVVPRFFPRLSRLGEIRKGLSWEKLLRSRELSSSAIIILAVILLLASHASWVPEG